jgi:hypothetical protein
MTTSEYRLTVAQEPDENGLYLVTFHGKEFALATEPQFTRDFSYSSNLLTRAQIEFSVVEIPPPPPPPPKRTAATHLGLRRPRCTRSSS